MAHPRLGAVAATVRMIQDMIERRGSLIGKLVAGVIGLAWALASFLVVPVLAFEDVGPLDALRRSAGRKTAPEPDFKTFRKAWFIRWHRLAQVRPSVPATALEFVDTMAPRVVLW